MAYDFDDFDLELAQQINYDGFADVECSAGCGHAARIEPDADYECPECGEGRLTSPLRAWGII